MTKGVLQERFRSFSNFCSSLNIWVMIYMAIPDTTTKTANYESFFSVEWRISRERSHVTSLVCTVSPLLFKGFWLFFIVINALTFLDPQRWLRLKVIFFSESMELDGKLKPWTTMNPSMPYDWDAKKGRSLSMVLPCFLNTVSRDLI